MKSATPLTSTSENALGPQYWSEQGSLLAPSSNDKRQINYIAPDGEVLYAKKSFCQVTKIMNKKYPRKDLLKIYGPYLLHHS